MTVILSCDPSINDFGYAVLRGGVPVCQALVAAGTIKSDATSGDAARLSAIGKELHRLCRQYAVTHVAVEVPGSLYVERGRSQTALKVLLAIGAAWAVAGALFLPAIGIPVHAWKGAQTEKWVTTAIAELLWPAWKLRADASDAAVLGVAAAHPTAVRAAHLLIAQGFQVPAAAGGLVTLEIRAPNPEDFEVHAQLASRRGRPVRSGSRR